MRITQEADYALRILQYLGCNCDNEQADSEKVCPSKIVEAKKISDEINVPLRFSLKILRKLVIGEVIKSFKGVNGGYMLNKKLSEINLKQIIELIDGPIVITRCLCDDYECSKESEDKGSCTLHKIFNRLNEAIAKKLELITLDILRSKGGELDEIINNMF